MRDSERKEPEKSRQVGKNWPESEQERTCLGSLKNRPAPSVPFAPIWPESFPAATVLALKASTAEESARRE